MNIESIIEENKTLKKKVKNLRRTKLRLKNHLNKIITDLKKNTNDDITKNWETLNIDK